MQYFPLPGDDLVWWKGAFVPNFAPELWRTDDHGALMFRPAYGDRDSDFAWEEDHIQPTSLGGLSSIFNRRPLFWRNNVERNSLVPVFWRYNPYLGRNMQF